jgi:uncharacterized protein (DUF1800 family)
MLTRFTAGVTDERIADIAAAGGASAWFEQQLEPGNIPDRQATELWSWFPVLALTPEQKWERYKAGTEQGWQMMQDLASWIMLRRLISKRQVAEMMVDFWSNLLHVPSPATNIWVWRVEYEETIRQNCLGRYDDLLYAAITHPAMGIYLNNVESTALAINENLGRELLECHTVGVDAGYSQREVVSSARILTGFHVDMNHTWEQTYVPADHWVGRVKVLGFTSPNAHADGRPVLRNYLSYLAHHPLTAKRLCTRLATRFVSDSPSDDLVDSLASVYLDSDTAILPVLQALVASDEFQNSYLEKVRTPVEDALATWTAVRAVVAQPHEEQDAANQFINLSKMIGQVVYEWPTPNGFPDVSTAWLGAGRILGSLRAHWTTASCFFPVQGITFRDPMDWMPALPARFDKVVAHVVQTALFLECTRTMVQTACMATDITASDIIDEDHPLLRYKFPRLLVSVLDAPEHLQR